MDPVSPPDLRRVKPAFRNLPVDDTWENAENGSYFFDGENVRVFRSGCRLHVNVHGGKRPTRPLQSPHMDHEAP